MLNFQDLKFSLLLSQQRISQSELLLGTSTLKRIMCYSLYNLGVNRQDISMTLNMSPGTIRSTIRAINQGGISAFTDRRKKTTKIDKIPLIETLKVFVNVET